MFWIATKSLEFISVRSFDNTRSETIQFHTPLTLIVGYNGSGKTTIIECLKYATTGDLPPNSKGGAFIHDPKLCGEKEVLAQVKLSFKGTSGAKMVATRSLQLTVKRTTRQQKTLEGQLLMIKEGERTAISSRVAELDQIMPQYLGVSKAILDSVIFCHQDESLWPMSEPSVLKKKFDEIFEAIRYTKAIDNIKVLRKKQNEELDKEKADKAEKRSLMLQDEIEALRTETHQLTEEMRQSESYAQVLGALEATIDNLKRHLVELDEPDEWLESNLEQFETKQLQYQQQEEEQVEETRHKLGLKQAEYGKYENDKANFEQLARNHNIHVDEFMIRIRKILREQNQALDRAKREAQSELREAQTLLNRVNERKSVLQESKNAAKRQIAANDKEAASYQAKLNGISVDEGAQAALESNVEDIQSRLDQAKERERSTFRDNEIQALNSQIRELEDGSSRLNAELIEATKKAGDLARLDHLKKEQKDRERSLETMKGAHGERLSNLVDTNWKLESLEQDFQTTLEDESKALEQVEYKMNNIKKLLDQRQKELKECIEEIREAIDDEPEEYSEIVKQRQAQLDLARKDIDQYAGVGGYMSQCLQTAKEQKTELQTFWKKLEALVKKTERQAEEEEIKQFEDDLAIARAASTAYDTWSRLKETEIPELKKEEDKYVVQRDELLSQLEERDKFVNEATEKKRDVEALSKTVSTIVRYDKLSSKQQDAGTPRTLEDIQDEITSIGEKSRALKKSLAKLTSDKEQARAELNKLELHLRDVQSSLDNVKFQLEKKTDLVTRINEYKSLNHQQREAIAKADKDIEDLTPELLKYQAKYDDIKLANEEIDAYNERGGPNQLERSKRELQTIEEGISQLETEQAGITRTINKISAQLKDSENTKRHEIEELEAQNAEVDRSRFKEESERRSREHNALSAKQSSKMGEMKSKDDQLMQLLSDWNTDYKDAAYKYKEAHIKVETTKAAVDDLARYGSALDKAIMKYHGLKMEEINAIIGELWQKTYRGTDVDTILIRSDNENPKGNRSYNYRVCMVKQGAEMDMRGRCSAGQKVLASIIIRLALAECFGVNCGLIALDEPTTNLDRDNIRSLAESLHDIIRARQQQANFQLIVITHDEEFLRHMQCGDFSDYYYRVSRNERQKSIIERQSIAELMLVD
ncbi:AAA domain-containing protein [Aspergillus venezuelensis]